MKTILLSSILFCTTVLFSQTTIVLQPDPAAGKDAKIFNQDALQNFGSDIDLIAATWTFGGEPGTLRSVIQFDLSSIPAGATILDARLSLYYNFVSGSAGQAGENAAFLRRITESWDENIVNWNNQPAFTNDNQVYLPQSTSADQDYLNIDVSPLISDMLADPLNSFGFMFMGENEVPLSSMKFFTSDASQTTQRPRLEITYTLDPVECLTLQPGSEGKDAKVFSQNTETNYGNDQDLIAAAWTFGGSEGILRSFIEFDLSAIPQNSEVISANLSLYYNDQSGSAGHEGLNRSLLQRVLEPWNEQAITWGNQPASTSTNQVILPQSTSMNQDYVDINVTALVMDMLANPGAGYGFAMKLETEEVFRSMKFATSDFSDPDRRPKLELCYMSTVANKEILYKQCNIRPNPFDQSIILENLDGQYLITISDVNGRKVYEEERESAGSEIQIDGLSHLANGIYFIRAIGESSGYFSKAVKL